MTEIAQTPAVNRPGSASAAGLWRWLLRRFRRQTPLLPLAGVAASINGQVLGVSSVNAAGFCALGYRGPLHPQDRFGFALTLDGADIAGDAVVAWRREGGLGIAFYDLSDAERGRLSVWLVNRGG